MGRETTMCAGGEETGEAREGVGPGHDMTRSMELVWRGQRGDASAVNELLTRYIPRMRRVVSVKVGWRRGRIDPDDVLQETLIVATKRLSELEVRTPSSILQWMAKIVDFEIKNRLEHQGAQKRDPAREQHLCVNEDSTDSADSGVVVVSADPTGSQILSRKELEQQMDECVAKLEPPDYHEVILMRDYYDADWEEIRVKLGRPTIEAVRDLHKRALERLRERLARLRG